jgi:CubicO group peptidase (beta-lactamase class C family)
MTTPGRIAALVMVCLLVSCSDTPARPPDESGGYEDRDSYADPVSDDAEYRMANEQVDSWFAQFITPETPGGVALIVKDGVIVHQAAYGLADLEHATPLTVDHAFHLASMSKQMTALCIMMLAEQQKLSYDDPVGRYLPELQKFGDALTIRRMLNHTSGLPDYQDGVIDPLMKQSDHPTNDDLLQVIKRTRKLLYPPGDQSHYSNVGYDLLAIVIERVSGMTFPEFVQTRIFDVLGMTHTFSLPNDARMDRDLIALSYTGSSDEPEVYRSDELDGIYGSGSIYSTIGDMALYDEALYGDVLVSQDTYAEALKPAMLNDGSSDPYGFGLELGQWHADAYAAHSGAWLGFNTDYVRFPARHLSVVVLLNRDYDYPDDPRIALQVAEFYRAEP